MMQISPEKMTTAEKIAVMETLWVDLCQHNSLDSPDWHQSVLNAREQQRVDGGQAPIDWEEAKKSIRKQL